MAPLYSMNPNFRKRFIKKLTRQRSPDHFRQHFLALGITFSGACSFPNCANSKRIRARRFFTGIKKLINQIFLNASITG